MRIPAVILLIGACHLFLLIATVYISVFLRMRGAAKFTCIRLLPVISQAFNLVILRGYVSWYEGLFSPSDGNVELFVAAQVAFILFLLFRLVLLFRKILSNRNKKLTPWSIREAVDYLPDGICFSSLDGIPILTNHRMNELVYQLTGHTIINVQSIWNELRQAKFENGCVKLEDTHISIDDREDEHKEYAFFSFPDGAVWRFCKRELRDRMPHYIQLDAADISDLYRHTKQLHETNKRLRNQYERRQSLLVNIVEINRQKEILAAKMRIHSDLGRSILTTKQHLWSQSLYKNIPYLEEIWNSAIRNLTNVAQLLPDVEDSPENELQKAADMIGCDICYSGDRPTDRRASLLLYAAVREALLNAVRHAKATVLNVNTSPTEWEYRVEITDNGNLAVSSVTEGSGLYNLRKRIEQEGGTLSVNIRNGGVILTVLIPHEGKNESVGDEVGQ